MRKITPSKKTMMEILFIPCIILIFMLEGLEGSFLRKKYPPTSPNVKNSLQLFFFSLPFETLFC